MGVSERTEEKAVCASYGLFLFIELQIFLRREMEERVNRKKFIQRFARVNCSKLHDTMV
jgi:hypothetical protein